MYVFNLDFFKKIISILKKEKSFQGTYAYRKYLFEDLARYFNADKFENLVGDDASFNANKMIEIFKGKDNDFSKAVCLNAAAGLMVNEKFIEFLDAYNFSREFILSGKPYSHLEKIQNV